MKALIVFVKYPRPGDVKTRLGAQVGLEVAAELYKLFIQQTFALCQQSCADEIFVALAPNAPRTAYKGLIPANFKAFAQVGTTLGDRLQHAFRYVFSCKAEKALAIGSDSPTLPVDYIDQAFAGLEGHDLVLGPAEDGGYYLIGSKEWQPELFNYIQWSSNSVYSATVERARQLRLHLETLPLWYDIDDLASLRRAVNDDKSGEIASYLSQQSDVLNRLK